MNPVERLLGAVINPVVDAVDVDGVVSKVDIDRLISEVDLDALMASIKTALSNTQTAAAALPIPR